MSETTIPRVIKTVEGYFAEVPAEAYCSLLAEVSIARLSQVKRDLGAMLNQGLPDGALASWRRGVWT